MCANARKARRTTKRTKDNKAGQPGTADAALPTRSQDVKRAKHCEEKMLCRLTLELSGGAAVRLERNVRRYLPVCSPAARPRIKPIAPAPPRRFLISCNAIVLRPIDDATPAVAVPSIKLCTEAVEVPSEEAMPADALPPRSSLTEFDDVPIVDAIPAKFIECFPCASNAGIKRRRSRPLE
jgi:hypothetical protein